METYWCQLRARSPDPVAACPSRAVAVARGRRRVSSPPAPSVLRAPYRFLRGVSCSPRVWFISAEGCAQPALPTTLAGTPATVVAGGTSSSTTEPAAIREQQPIAAGSHVQEDFSNDDLAQVMAELAEPSARLQFTSEDS